MNVLSRQIHNAAKNLLKNAHRTNAPRTRRNNEIPTATHILTRRRAFGDHCRAKLVTRTDPEPEPRQEPDYGAMETRR